MNKSRSGFTIVELLIVIVVIGILAAITIIAYGNIQSRAKQSALVHDLTTAKKRFDLARIEKDAFPATFNELQTYGLGKISTQGVDIVSAGSPGNVLLPSTTGKQIPKGKYGVYVNGQRPGWGGSDTGANLRIYYWDYVDGHWKQKQHIYYSAGMLEVEYNYNLTVINTQSDAGSLCKDAYLTIRCS